jgi:hypothetical protein
LVQLNITPLDLSKLKSATAWCFSNASMLIRFNYRLGMSDKNHTDFHINMLEADPLKLTIKTEPSITEHIDKNLKSDRFEGIGIGKNNHSHSNLRWDSSEQPALQAEMMGNRSNYPFDSYNASIILAIPKTPDNHINKKFSSEFTPVAADNWNIFASSKSIGSHLVENIVRMWKRFIWFVRSHPSMILLF